MLMMDDNVILRKYHSLNYHKRMSKYVFIYSLNVDFTHGVYFEGFVVYQKVNLVDLR